MKNKLKAKELEAFSRGRAQGPKFNPQCQKTEKEIKERLGETERQRQRDRERWGEDRAG
jgi:predicted secreted Zn-dependent protease